MKILSRSCCCFVEYYNNFFMMGGGRVGRGKGDFLMFQIHFQAARLTSAAGEFVRIQFLITSSLKPRKNSSYPSAAYNRLARGKIPWRIPFHSDQIRSIKIGSIKLNRPQRIPLSTFQTRRTKRDPNPMASVVDDGVARWRAGRRPPPIQRREMDCDGFKRN